MKQFNFVPIFNLTNEQIVERQKQIAEQVAELQNEGHQLFIEQLQRKVSHAVQRSTTTSRRKSRKKAS